MKENVVKRNWLRILSPAVLGMVICVIGIIISFVGLETSGGWSFLGVIILAPVFGILLAIDFIAKLIIKDKTFFYLDCGIAGIIACVCILDFHIHIAKNERPTMCFAQVRQTK